MADTPDLYLCRLPPERLWREQGSMNAAVVQASAWVSVLGPQAAVAEVLAVQEEGLRRIRKARILPPAPTQRRFASVEKGLPGCSVEV